ncbi:hypothetical protein HPP92_002641 [Vanilla planifolia]|uniref:Uncharacterized protein n=1 Tax=Vanilla planifolia TaxID=51239 RepID=A0A835VJ54_VANPL|nr:hypothetical protein HPP92_002641 [Vanilla planifolia]
MAAAGFASIKTESGYMNGFGYREGRERRREGVLEMLLPSSERKRRRRREVARRREGLGYSRHSVRERSERSV